MKRKITKFISLFLLVTVIFGLSSCTYFDIFSVDSLIRAPKLTGENAEIQMAFENAVGKNVSLVNPLSGEYRSAYVLFDYNFDGMNEAIVFYSKQDTPAEIRLNLLEFYDGKWQSTCDVTGNGSEVYEISFVNLDKDSQLEVAVVWSLSDSKRNKTLSLYKPTPANSSSTQKSLTQISSTQITDYLFSDMDFDNQNELFYTYFSFEADVQVYSSVIAKVDSSSFSLIPISEVGISKSIEQPIGIKCDVKDAVFTVYIDCLANDGRYFTEIITYDYINKILLRPIAQDGTYISAQTYRYEQILCEDIDSDYMIEIPSQSEYADSFFEDSGVSEKIYVTSFSQFRDGQLHSTNSYYINEQCDFKIQVSDFFDISYLQINKENRSFSFRLKDCQEDDDLLFTVTVHHNERHEDGYGFEITPLGERYSFTERKINGLIAKK